MGDPTDTPAPGPAHAPVREAFLRELARDRSEVRSRSTTLATCVVGAPDLGKAWVVETARRAAEQEGFETLLCRAEPDDALVPLSLFRGALASWHRDGRAGPAWGGQGAKGGATGPEGGGASSPEGILELSSLVLGGMLSTGSKEAANDPSKEAQAEYDRLVHSLADLSQTALEKRSRLLTQIRRFLVSRAQEAPLLLALEDLQLADQVSADLVAVLLEWRTEAPLWLLLTYTREEDLYPPLRRALERTFLAQVAVRRPLAPMSLPEVRLFLTQQPSGRIPIPTGTMEEIVRRSEGMPGVATRLARIYQTQGVLPGAKSPAAEEADERFTDLTEEQERVLALAAVAGPSAPFELLRKAAGEEEERMSELLEELVQRGLLVERSRGVFAFTEEPLRTRTYQELTAARRRVLHRKVGEALEALPGGRDPGRVFALAHHYTQGKADEKALEYLRSAIDLARSTGSLPREKELLEQMLTVHERAHPKEARGEAELLHQLGSVAYALGADDAATQSLSRARDLLANLHETGSTYAGVLLDLARVTARRGDAAIARSLAEESLEHFRKAGNQLGVAWARRFRSRLAYSAGDYPAASEDLRRSLEALQLAKAPRAEIGRATTGLADVEFMLDPTTREGSTQKLEEGIQMLLADEDKAGALFAEVGRAAIEYALADERAAHATMERARALVPEVPEVWRLLEAMLRKAVNHVQKGEMKEALGLADAARDLGKILGDPEREGRALLFGTDVAARMVLLERAEKSAEAALEIGRSCSLRRTQAEALYRLALASNMRGRVSEARERLAEADRLAEGQEVSRTAQMLRRDLKEALEEGPR